MTTYESQKIQQVKQQRLTELDLSNLFMGDEKKLT